jgi:ribosome-associated translation inhibitor RaiA
MNVELLTKGFQKTDAMDAYMREATLEGIESFLKNERDVHLRVTVDEASHRMQSRKPHYICEIHLKTAASKKFFKVQKNGEDFYDVVLRAGQAIRRVLGKKSDRRHTMRVEAWGGKLTNSPAA